MTIESIDFEPVTISLKILNSLWVFLKKNTPFLELKNNEFIPFYRNFCYI